MQSYNFFRTVGSRKEAIVWIQSCKNQTNIFLWMIFKHLFYIYLYLFQPPRCDIKFRTLAYCLYAFWAASSVSFCSLLYSKFEFVIVIYSHIEIKQNEFKLVNVWNSAWRQLKPQNSTNKLSLHSDDKQWSPHGHTKLFDSNTLFKATTWVNDLITTHYYVNETSSSWNPGNGQSAISRAQFFKSNFG